MKIRLFYTEISFWRAEVSRLALYIGNIDFEDVRMTWREDFDTMGNTGKLPYGVTSPFRQIPVLEVDGQVIGQTAGIARFCGKLSGLYPKNAKTPLIARKYCLKTFCNNHSTFFVVGGNVI